MELIFELQSKLGTTVILVTHDPDLAGRCTHRIELKAGRLV
jgi:putative ABC transport system ATP-binding protein